MFPPKKKPEPKKGLDVMIAVGKPGLGAPKPFEKRDEPDEETPDPMAQHEAAESSEYEEQEESGADILKDIEAVGQRYGADGPTAHAFTADILEAVARCLKRGSGEVESPAEDQQEQPVA